MNVIGIALEELYRIFNVLNRDKFDGKLPEPVVTIQKTKGQTLGHFTVSKVWKDKNDAESEDNAYYEINVDPRWFNNRSSAEVAETLLHEMCHYCNKMNDIKDCNGNVHNKKFKSLAESVGLVVEKDKSVGYGCTSMSNTLKTYMDEVVRPNDKAFEYFRSVPVKASGTGNGRKKNVFKYTCPTCGQEVKGKRDVIIRCGRCDVIMEMEDVQSEN